MNHRFSCIASIALALVFTAKAGDLPLPQWPDDLAAGRREFLERALEFSKLHPVVPYKLGGADASGMDCSGASTCLLKRIGIHPPRSAHGQYLWLGKLGRLTTVPTTARTPEDKAFALLKPGDLVFWTHDGPDAPEEIHASHVHVYLGREKDGHAIMIGSSEGRSYRGTKVHGFGITDFRVPKAGSATRIIAYGPPPFDPGSKKSAKPTTSTSP